LKWNASVIQGMLKNEIYTGKAFFQDVVKEVPALIDEVIFKKVQDKLATNPKYLEKSRNHTHLLQKKVLCGHCGNLMYGHIDADNKTGRYMCSSYHSSKVLCGNTTLGYDKFEAIIWNFIKNQSYIFQNLEQEEKDKLIANIANEKVSLISQITLKEGFIRQENNKISNLLDLVKASAGAFKMDDVIRDKIEIDKSIAEYENEIQKLRSSISLIDNRIEQIRSAEFSEESITKIEADRLQMKKVVNDVIDLITVYKIDNNSIVLQVAMYDYPVFNILVNQRSKRIFKYWYIEEHTANFLRGKYKPSIIPESDNFYFCNPTELAESTYWEYYAFEEMCSILEHSGLSSEYMPAIPFMNPKSVKPDVIPTDEEDFKEYMNFKFGTTFDYES